MTLRPRSDAPAAVGLPAAGWLLRWVYVGRLAVAVAVFIAAAAVWRDATPGTTLAVSLLLIAAAAFTAASFWHTNVRGSFPGRKMLYAQVLFDTALVTTAVHLTGGPESVFAPLYILVICAAGVLLPLPGGILIGVLASLSYFVAMVWGSNASAEGGVFLQIGLFATVALVTGYLGDRLRQTDHVLDEVETELRLLRLDTDDILGSLHTGIMIVDGNGTLAFLNPAATELTGLVPQQWIGEPVLGVLDRLAPGLGDVIARSARTRKPIRRFETEEVEEGGLVFGVSTTVMERPTSGAPAVSVIFQDITERKRMDALRRRSERLEAVAELSASLAHEIKNPLASIRSATEQLGLPGVDAEDKAVLEALVIRESDRLSRLLTEFLDFARVRAETARPVDLATLVRNVVELVRAHPDAEGRALHLAVDPAALLVRGDEDLLHRAVLNLVLNAAQWAGDGGRAEIAVDRVQSDIFAPSLGAADAVRIRVADTGPGVPPDAVEHIFDPFVTYRAGGTGLGLALVQRATEAHGGAVFVENGYSPAGEGAVFSLFLPALPAGETAELPRISQPALV